MSYLGYHQLKIKGIDALQDIEQLTINIEPNRHARLRLKGLMQEKTGFQYLEEQLENKPVRLIAADQTGQTLFEGQVVDAKIIEDKGVSFLELEGLSGTINLDLQQKSRSFQNTELTYQQVIRQVIQDIPHCIAKYQVGQNEKINVPIIQYLEKDWDFIRRLASHFGTVVIPDVTAAYPRFWFGMPEGESHTLEQDVEYRVSKDFGRYHELGGAAAGYNPDDFLTYQVRTWRNFVIGDQVRFKGKQLVVGAKKGIMEKGLWVYIYTLAFAPALGLKKRYNTKISGMSLQGKVLETKGERLKVHLDIDQTQDQNTAYWYPWAPTSGNMMYCMPQVGTKVVLYFPNEHEGQARITGCVRTNGAACEATSDANNRYFTTEHNKQMALLPAELSFAGTGSKESPLKLSMLDQTGITLENHKNLQLYAKDKIEFSSDKRIYCEAKKSFDAGKMDLSTGTPAIQSLMTLKYEHNFLAPNVLIEASTHERLQPEKTFDKRKFWGNVLLGALAVVAVTAVIVASPAILAAAGVATIAAVTVSGWAMGAFVGGMIAVGAKAFCDYKNKDEGDPADYMLKGLVGAVGGAISGPAQGLKACLIWNGVGCAAGTLIENTINVVRGKSMDVGTFVSSVGYSAAGGLVAGGLCHAGTAGIQKVIGNTLAKMPNTRAAGQYIMKYATKFGNKVADLTSGGTARAGDKIWLGKLSEAYAKNSKEIITNFMPEDVLREKQLAKEIIHRQLVKKVLENPDIFKQAAFTSKNVFIRSMPTVLGDTGAEASSRLFEAGGNQLGELAKNNAFIVKGAKFKCSCGSMESNAGLAMSHGVYVTGCPALNAYNKVAMENILDFDHCKTTKGKCVPTIVGEWNQAKKDVKINGEYVITCDSWLTCSKGGQIKVNNSGQKTK